jgi:site-specific DNA-methyltransferase (adenine-specific)
VWTDVHRVKHNKYRDTHPCQLPIYLFERLVLMATDENNIVLDPFVGTGACRCCRKEIRQTLYRFLILTIIMWIITKTS